MAIAFVGLGTNIGNRRKNLIAASCLLAERVGDVVRLSTFSETEPWGFESENQFLNAVIELRTSFSPSQLLNETKRIEIEMGRSEKTQDAYRDRIIDLDILLYDDQIVESTELTIPHPLMQERKFVMQPMAEIAPLLIHPTIKKNMTELNERL